MNYYVGSDGEDYTEDTIWRKLESESWAVCCWDIDTGLQAFETEDEELLFLRPVDWTGATVAGGNTGEPL